MASPSDNSLLSMSPTLGGEAQSAEEPDFCPLAESVRELKQAMQEFVSITQEDIMEDLEIEEPEAGYQQSLMTIFRQVLGPPADRQEAEKPSHCPEDRVVGCAPPSLGVGWNDNYMLVITSLMSRLTIGPGGDNVGRGENMLRNC